jgi:UrcA family protein
MNTEKIRGLKSILATLTTLAYLAGANLAMAETGMDHGAPAINVKYDPVTAATPAGAEALYKRIEGAASKVCERYESRELARHAVWQKCYAQTIANAVASVRQPALTALHASRTATNTRG